MPHEHCSYYTMPLAVQDAVDYYLWLIPELMVTNYYPDNVVRMAFGPGADALFFFIGADGKRGEVKSRPTIRAEVTLRNLETPDYRS